MRFANGRTALPPNASEVSFLKQKGPNSPWRAPPDRHQRPIKSAAPVTSRKVGGSWIGRRVQALLVPAVVLFGGGNQPRCAGVAPVFTCIKPRNQRSVTRASVLYGTAREILWLLKHTIHHPDPFFSRTATSSRVAIPRGAARAPAEMCIGMDSTGWHIVSAPLQLHT
jgi:hypothetical protein